ncbi:FAD-dependent 5-carboxymethylaminomethyl-2-thiouridine(34) oxidoreductase MnmC [Pontibacter sp. JAM-7]|uniref:FAD-dependent 5-carboxymethylaminomethyl-2-thiouridine(34) oxidoreductase MnmC n=1 Tax=Pontibacter sp. JAM-7 TaxID=3366581 RepID=UPI003AF51E4C
MSTSPWFALPYPKPTKHVIVSGAGLAGCTTAWALAQRGVKVTVLDAASAPAQGGSGNPQGALYAKLSVTPTKQSELHICGSHYSLNLLRHLDPEQTFWSECDVMQIATSSAELKRQTNLLLHNAYPADVVGGANQSALTDLIQQPVTADGLIMKLAGWVSPAEFCCALLEHPNIEWHGNSRLVSLQQDNGEWQLQVESGQQYRSGTVILCHADATKQLEQTQHLPLKPIRGQVSTLPASVTDKHLQQVVCGEGYISPPYQDQYCFGATFELHEQSTCVTASAHQTNLDNLAKILPELAEDFVKSKHLLTGRVSFRCSTPDYLPVVGPAPDISATLQRFAPLRKDRNWQFPETEPAHLPGLYVNCGHGSKGLITTPLCGEYLASLICNEPLPLAKPLLDALNPCRFLIKDLIRKRI